MNPLSWQLRIGKYLSFVFVERHNFGWVSSNNLLGWWFYLQVYFSYQVFGEETTFGSLLLITPDYNQIILYSRLSSQKGSKSEKFVRLASGKKETGIGIEIGIEIEELERADTTFHWRLGKKEKNEEGMLKVCLNTYRYFGDYWCILELCSLFPPASFAYVWLRL